MNKAGIRILAFKIKDATFPKKNNIISAKKSHDCY